jgi:transcriptional regulator with XRE-family HTH domain
MDAWVPEDSFGMRLRILRYHLGLSVEELSERCAVRPATWGKWERGESEPRSLARVIGRIVAATGVNRDWLLWGGPLAGSSTRWLTTPAPAVNPQEAA